MDYIRIEGVAPYDGRYEFDLRGGAFSVREWGWIKRHTGYLPLTLDDGLVGSDAELYAVFAIIALVRSGTVARDDFAQAWERFLDAPGVVTVSLELGDSEEADAVEDPPGNSTESGAISGNGSQPSSESLTVLPPVIGTRDSDTSESLPATG